MTSCCKSWMGLGAAHRLLDLYGARCCSCRLLQCFLKGGTCTTSGTPAPQSGTLSCRVCSRECLSEGVSWVKKLCKTSEKPFLKKWCFFRARLLLTKTCGFHSQEDLIGGSGGYPREILDHARCKMVKDSEFWRANWSFFGGGVWRKEDYFFPMKMGETMGLREVAQNHVWNKNALESMGAIWFLPPKWHFLTNYCTHFYCHWQTYSLASSQTWFYEF